MRKKLEFEEIYEAVTRGIRVSVKPRFLIERSNPDAGQFVWAYEVEITNEGPVTVQLRDRSWTITDGFGNQQLVHGPGVVGEQPVLNPEDCFRYTSGCPLETSSGFMVGHYTMVTEEGEKFKADIPAFALDLPNVQHAVN